MNTKTDTPELDTATKQKTKAALDDASCSITVSAMPFLDLVVSANGKYYAELDVCAPIKYTSMNQILNAFADWYEPHSAPPPSDMDHDEYCRHIAQKAWVEGFFLANA